MKAVRSIETRGMISTSCSDATSSSSGGVIDVLRDGGRAMFCELCLTTLIAELSADNVGMFQKRGKHGRVRARTS